MFHDDDNEDRRINERVIREALAYTGGIPGCAPRKLAQHLRTFAYEAPDILLEDHDIALELASMFEARAEAATRRVNLRLLCYHRARKAFNAGLDRFGREWIALAEFSGAVA